MRSRLPAVRDLAKSCRLCPHNCEIDRLQNVHGTCKLPYGPVVSNINLHFGEEPPISGTRGSGTVFMTGCSLSCLFCQNYPLSQLRRGSEITTIELARQLIQLQIAGAHNINFVTPTPQAAAIYEALMEAFALGLQIPIVYNCSGYESLEMIRLWEGIVDIYLPDSKYGCEESAIAISKAEGYPEHNRAALKEMRRQVGTLKLSADGIASKGMIVRHLVLPGELADTEVVLRFIADHLGEDTHVSLMSQYFPSWKAGSHLVLNRGLTRAEYTRAVELLESFGLYNGWIQPFGGEDD